MINQVKVIKQIPSGFFLFIFLYTWERNGKWWHVQDIFTQWMSDKKQPVIEIGR